MKSSCPDMCSTVNLTEKETFLEPFVLKDLLPPSLGSYYRYSGSLTTPPCSKVVEWIIFSRPIYISYKQVCVYGKRRTANIIVEDTFMVSGTGMQPHKHLSLPLVSYNKYFCNSKWPDLIFWASYFLKTNYKCLNIFQGLVSFESKSHVQQVFRLMGKLLQRAIGGFMHDLTEITTHFFKQNRLCWNLIMLPSRQILPLCWINQGICLLIHKGRMTEMFRLLSQVEEMPNRNPIR